MNACTQNIALTLALLLVSCSRSTPPPQLEESQEISVFAAELLATDGAWGNTEGPAVDSAGAVYFTSRGTYKGIIKWNQAEGARQYAAVATMAGPGGLWIDEADNIYLTATDEREVQRLSPSGEITTIAKGFEANPATAMGPNDITVSRAGRVYFTDPNGYYGESAPGTIYIIDIDGSVRVFDDTVVGPNGVVLSADGRTLYVANNVGQTRSNLDNLVFGRNNDRHTLYQVRIWTA
jgi:gluconolactonase